ncbi:MAG: hypothetical protein JXM75_10015, partial [Chromatiaceae bacterium]|nr:hypothetical protein [Chromatiaceae bacterium]
MRIYGYSPVEAAFSRENPAPRLRTWPHHLPVGAVGCLSANASLSARGWKPLPQVLHLAFDRRDGIYWATGLVRRLTTPQGLDEDFAVAVTDILP